jgi:archaellum component FlaC
MNPQLFHKPFFQVTLPLMGTIIVATWAMVSVNNRRLDDMRDGFNKRLDDLNKRLDDLIRRLDRVETRLDNIEGVLRDFGQRLTRLEERTSPIHR